MVVGGDVVQNAFAQGTGKLYTPVCFSFGCVAYAFTTLVGIIGDGRLLPRPDYPAKVLNLGSGYRLWRKHLTTYKAMTIVICQSRMSRLSSTAHSGGNAPRWQPRRQELRELW